MFLFFSAAEEALFSLEGSYDLPGREERGTANLPSATFTSLFIRLREEDSDQRRPVERRGARQACLLLTSS